VFLFSLTESEESIEQQLLFCVFFMLLSFEIEELWDALRPTTVDETPIDLKDFLFYSSTRYKAFSTDS